MLGSDDKPFRTNVEAAVAYLIGKGVIKKDMDIVNALKMSKGTFSAYKSGKTEPSKNFIQEFENYYGIKLSDFDINKQIINDPHTGYEVIFERDEECEKVKIEVGYLKQRISDLEETIKDKNEIIALQRSLLHGHNGGNSKRLG